jgi:uridine phosphorylase
MEMIVQHMNACKEDMQGNGSIGRYIFLAGSDGRAREISELFINWQEKTHPRQHNLYLGQMLTEQGQKIDVASISTGMGGASADIIINELVMLGAKRLLRVGTSGSLHPKQIHVGDIIVATGAVRDDKSSWDYIYPEYPAMASFEYIQAAREAKVEYKESKVHFGVVHSKSSLFAREFQFSLLPDNRAYMDALRRAGVLATEMECAQFFTLAPILSSRMNYLFSNQTPIFSGAILAIIGDETGFSADKQCIMDANQRAIQFAMLTTKHLFHFEQSLHSR